MYRTNPLVSSGYSRGWEKMESDCLLSRSFCTSDARAYLKLWRQLRRRGARRIGSGRSRQRLHGRHPSPKLEELVIGGYLGGWPGHALQTPPFPIHCQSGLALPTFLGVALGMSRDY